MKILTVMFLVSFCYVQCRKISPQINKSANVDFINMEGGGGVKPGAKPSQPAPAKLPSPTPAPSIPKPTPVPAKPTPAPVKPSSGPAKPTIVVPTPAPNKLTPPTQIKPVPVNPSPVKNPITTPGPGSVKQLITFYDSQGKASPIRPYSYSQAVKQG